MKDETILKEGERYYDGDWVVEVGEDGYIALSFFYNDHYFSEIILNVKDGVNVVRHD